MSPTPKGIRGNSLIVIILYNIYHIIPEELVTTDTANQQYGYLQSVATNNWTCSEQAKLKPRVYFLKLLNYVFNYSVFCLKPILIVELEQDGTHMSTHVAKV